MRRRRRACEGAPVKHPQRPRFDVPCDDKNRALELRTRARTPSECGMFGSSPLHRSGMEDTERERGGVLARRLGLRQRALTGLLFD